jgi:predicted transcriptional regulator
MHMSSLENSQRKRVEIVALILEIANSNSGGSSNEVNELLDSNQLEEYLSVVQNKGFLEYDEARNTYRTTNKGLHFLQIYRSLVNWLL